MKQKKHSTLIALILASSYLSACSTLAPSQVAVDNLLESAPIYARSTPEQSLSNSFHQRAYPSYSGGKRVLGLINGTENPPTPEEYKAEMSRLTKGWFFGHGVGTAIFNIGTAVSFPPYGVYLLSNAGLEASGFGAVYPTDLMPRTPAKYLKKGFRGLVSIPGRLNALIFRKRFREFTPITP